MSQVSVTKCDTVVPFAGFASGVIESVSDRLKEAYRKALGSLIRMFPVDTPSFDDFDTINVGDWVISMIADGVSVNTARYYLENISAIYSKAVKSGLAGNTDSFAIVKSRLAEVATGLRRLEHDVNKLRGLYCQRDEIRGEKRQCFDLFMFSVFNRGMDVEQILRLTKEDTSGMCDAALNIIDGYVSSRRKSVFPRVGIEVIKDRVALAMSSLGLDIRSGNAVGEAAAGIWAQTALTLGVRPSEVKHLLRYDLPLFSITDGPVLPSTPDIDTMVANAITHNPVYWRVMKMRRGSTLDNIKERLASEGRVLPEFFYPYEEITVRTGKKLQYRSQPVINDIVFFKSADSDIKPMFRIIGDMAWCFRIGGAGGSAYAIVPNNDMERFQRTIGVFTSDLNLVPIGSNEVTIGRMARIIGGQMAGYEGRIFSLARHDGNVRVLQLKFPDSNGIEWTVEIDERQIELID